MVERKMWNATFIGCIGLRNSRRKDLYLRVFYNNLLWWRFAECARRQFLKGKTKRKPVCGRPPAGPRFRIEI